MAREPQSAQPPATVEDIWLLAETMLLCASEEPETRSSGRRKAGKLAKQMRRRMDSEGSPPATRADLAHVARETIAHAIRVTLARKGQPEEYQDRWLDMVERLKDGHPASGPQTYRRSWGVDHDH